MNDISNQSEDQQTKGTEFYFLQFDYLLKFWRNIHQLLQL